MSEELTMREAKNDYKYLFNRLKETVVDISDENIRKVMEIVFDTCGACYNDDSGCQCRNDD